MDGNDFLCLRKIVKKNLRLRRVVQNCDALPRTGGALHMTGGRGDMIVSAPYTGLAVQGRGLAVHCTGLAAQ